PCSNAEAVAQFFHQPLSGPAQERAVFAPPFPKGVAQFLHPLGDCSRFSPTGQQNHELQPRGCSQFVAEIPALFFPRRVSLHLMPPVSLHAPSVVSKSASASLISFVFLF